MQRMRSLILAATSLAAVAGLALLIPVPAEAAGPGFSNSADSWITAEAFTGNTCNGTRKLVRPGQRVTGIDSFRLRGNYNRAKYGRGGMWVNRSKGVCYSTKGVTSTRQAMLVLTRVYV